MLEAVPQPNVFPHPVLSQDDLAAGTVTWKDSLSATFVSGVLPAARREVQLDGALRKAAAERVAIRAAADRRRPRIDRHAHHHPLSVNSHTGSVIEPGSGRCPWIGKRHVQVLAAVQRTGRSNCPGSNRQVGQGTIHVGVEHLVEDFISGKQSHVLPQRMTVLVQRLIAEILAEWQSTGPVASDQSFDGIFAAH